MSNFHKGPIKTKHVMLRIVNIPIWLEFKFVRDFMPVQISYKSDKDPIKTKQAMLRTRSNMVFSALSGK